jgi:uncharacterized membrane protein YoaK (UPF0700 family)
MSETSRGRDGGLTNPYAWHRSQPAHRILAAHPRAGLRARTWSAWTSDPDHGPLPALLLALTATTGLVDAVSILGLGRVFVANMTGNVVFVGFALTGDPEFSLAASAAALAGFLVGARTAGSLVARHGGRRGTLLRDGVTAELLLAAAALLIDIVDPGATVVITALLAAAMGVQNTIVRRLAVPDLSTTMLTLTLTGLAADTWRGRQATVERRLSAVLVMFAGAAVGSLLTLHASLGWALGFVVIGMAVTSLAASVASRRPGRWQAAARSRTT